MYLDREIKEHLECTELSSSSHITTRRMLEQRERQYLMILEVIREQCNVCEFYDQMSDTMPCLECCCINNGEDSFWELKKL